MKRYSIIFILLIGSLSLSIISCENEDKSIVDETQIEINEDVIIGNFSNTSSEGIMWMDWSSAIKAQAKLDKPIFVDVFTSWCAWCKKMDQGVFSDPYLAAYINEYYYPVKFDAQQKNELVLNGQTYNSKVVGNRTYHEWAVELLENDLSFPALLILDKNLDRITTMRGYQTAVSLEPTLVFFGENHFKEMKWSEFRERYLARNQ